LPQGRGDEPQADRGAHGCTLRSHDRGAARAHVGRRRGPLPEELGRRRRALAHRDDAALILIRAKALLSRGLGTALAARNVRGRGTPTLIGFGFGHCCGPRAAAPTASPTV